MSGAEVSASRSAFATRLSGWANALALLIVVLAPTQYSLELPGGVYVSPVDPLVWIAGGLVGLAAVLRGHVWRALAVVPLAAWAFVALALATVAVAGQRMDVLKEVFQYAEYFIVALILFRSGFDTPARRRMAALLLLGVTSVVLGYAALQYIDDERALMDVGATFGNRNVLGGYLCLALPFAFALSLFDRMVWVRVWAFVLLAAGIVVLLSGAAMIAIVASVVLVAALKGARYGLTAAALVVLAMVFVLPNLPRDNLFELGNSILLYPEYDISRRYPEWQAAWVMVEENPWLGVGAGNYQANIGMYFGSLPNPTGPNEPDTQNLYLVLASSLGLPALLCFFGMMSAAARSAVCGYLRSEAPMDRAIYVGAAAALFAFCIAAFWHPLIVRGIGVPLALIVSLALGPCRRSSEA